MRFYLKSIDVSKIVRSSAYSKELTEKACKRLNNLSVDLRNFSMYEGKEQISWFTSSEAVKEELKSYNESDNKEEFLIKWYFIRYVNNECFKLLNN